MHENLKPSVGREIWRWRGMRRCATEGNATTNSPLVLAYRRGRNYAFDWLLLWNPSTKLSLLVFIGDSPKLLHAGKIFF